VVTVAVFGAIVAFFVLGWLSRRAVIALIPALVLVAFQAVMLSSNDWYARVAEETQAFISFGLVVSVAATLIGVVASRAVASRRAGDAHKPSRRKRPTTRPT
jgi:ABC-type nickel/cobalt efflux system permease component RcnA